MNHTGPSQYRDTQIKIKKKDLIFDLIFTGVNVRLGKIVSLRANQINNVQKSKQDKPFAGFEVAQVARIRYEMKLKL